MLTPAAATSADKLKAACIRRDYGQPAMRLSNPDRTLLRFWRETGTSQRMLQLARIASDGTTLWKTQSGIEDLRQVLPDAAVRAPRALRPPAGTDAPRRGEATQPLILLDTHVAVWSLAEAPGLSSAAERIIRRHSVPVQIAMPAISVLVIATAIRRGRLPYTVPLERWLSDVRCIPEVRLEPVSADIAAVAGALPEPLARRSG